MAIQVQLGEQAKESKKKTRSPAYPAIDLEEALQRAELVRKEEGKNEAAIETVLHDMGYAPKSGAGQATLSALIKFGLLADEGAGANRKARLTPLALRILLDQRPDSPERAAAIKEAALSPGIHKELWKKYQGALPPDADLSYYLRKDREFLDDAATNLIKEFRRTLAFAKMSETDSISPKAQDKTEPDGELTMAPPPAINPPSSQSQSVHKSSEQSQQVTRTVQIPLTGAPWAMLQIPYPMTEENWEEMKSFLELMKRPLTTKEQPKQN
jgi:hypothetical protein